MPIVLAQLGPFHLARFTGDLTIDNAVQLGKDLETIFRQDKDAEFVFDLSHAGETDAAGVGTIISVAAKARGKGCRIYLYAPVAHVQQVMEQLQVTDFFPLIENEADLLSRLPD